MKFRNKVLSRLFTFKKKKVKLKKKEAPAKKMKVKMRVKSADHPAAQEKDAMQPETAVRAEAAARVEDAVQPTILILPAEHAMYRLFEVWQAEAGFQPSPDLRLENPGVLPAGWEKKELERLKSGITRVASARAGKLKPKNTPKPPEGEEPALPTLDAEPWIFLSADQLAAWVMVFPPVNGGAALNREQLTQALKQADVTFGVDEALLDRLPGQTNRYFCLFPVAKGQPAVDGKDGKIIDLFKRVVEKVIKPDEFGNVDYANISNIQDANEGDVICQLIPNTDGEPGVTVQNKPIAAKAGKTVTLPKGRNTDISEDGTKLVAAKTGHVEFDGRNFQVKPVLDISGNVDYSTGNINFLGDVHVRGDVSVGFSVRAVGSVRVDGTIEGTVEAGADLVVGRGILGGPNSVIRAHRNVFAKYMENSRVHARENLQADCIVNCDVYSDGVVQVCSGRGIILGGKVSAGQGITASVVGSKAEGQTLIILGGRPCAEYERELLVREIEEMQAEQKKLQNQPDGPAKVSRLSKLRMKISVNRMKLDQMDKDLTALHEALKEAPEGMNRAYLECGVAYPGTEITINGKSIKLTRETHKCMARLSVDGEIHLF